MARASSAVASRSSASTVPFAAAHDIVGRRGDIQQDQHRQIAVPALQHRVDARIGRVSGALGYCGDDAGIEIETISLRLTVPANRPTWPFGTLQSPISGGT